ncbi:MAG: serine O-acetyltransferase [Clostridia bacterium]|nr:serine O-acetyltransferase [Clostridia bacterium]
MGYFSDIKGHIDAAMENDPAARTKLEVFLLYPGVKALIRHKRAHWYYEHGCLFLARYVSQRTRKKTGIEIHPGAKIGKKCFIDHGMGIVIGETTEVGDNCVIYQGVTLGGTGKDKGKRHPTIGNNVVISCGARVLGPFTVGNNVNIGAGSVVLHAVPDDCTVVGIPGTIVRVRGENALSLRHDEMPDPVAAELECLQNHIFKLEQELIEVENERKQTN